MEIKKEDSQILVPIFFYMNKESWQENYQLSASLISPENNHGGYLGVFMYSKEMRVDVGTNESRAAMFLQHLDNKAKLLQARTEAELEIIANHKAQIQQLTYKPESED